MYEPKYYIYELDKTYDNSDDAASRLNVRPDVFSAEMSRKRYRDIHFLNGYHIKKFYRGTHLYRKKQVAVLDDQEIYQSVDHAAIAYSTDYSNIVHAISTGRPFKGKTFVYANDAMIRDFSPASLNAQYDRESKLYPDTIPIYVYRTRKVCYGIDAALRNANADHDFTLRNMFQNAYEHHSHKIISHNRKAFQILWDGNSVPARLGFKVRIEETGQKFNTITECAEAIGVSRQFLSDHIKKGIKTKGYTVVYGE